MTTAADTSKRREHVAGYMPKSSGMLSGGGVKKGSRKHIVQAFGVNLQSSKQDILEAVPWFDPRRKYTNNQKLLIAEKWLHMDPLPWQSHPAILGSGHLAARRSREIQVASGTPDPSIVQGMYNRTHPNGRKVSSDEARKNGASFYS